MLREQLAAETEADAVALALALAAKILAGTLAVEPERVLDTVRGALRRVTDRRRVTVLVDPADLEVVSAAIAEVEAQVGGIDHCDVQADRRVGRGGAIVLTLESEVDASVDTQLERAREVIQSSSSAAWSHSMSSDLLNRAAAALAGTDLARCHGRVNNLIGLIIEATGLQAEVGEVCLVGADRNRDAVPAEVVGFREGRTLLMPLGELQGIGPGTKVLPTGAPFRVPVGPQLLGRVIDGLGAPLDGLGAVTAESLAGTAGQAGRADQAGQAGHASQAHTDQIRARPGFRSTIAAPPQRCTGPASTSASRSACAPSTASCHAGAGSVLGSSPAPASASPRCSG